MFWYDLLYINTSESDKIHFSFFWKKKKKKKKKRNINDRPLQHIVSPVKAKHRAAVKGKTVEVCELQSDCWGFPA